MSGFHAVIRALRKRRDRATTIARDTGRTVLECEAIMARFDGDEQKTRDAIAMMVVEGR